MDDKGNAIPVIVNSREQSGLESTVNGSEESNSMARPSSSKIQTSPPGSDMYENKLFVGGLSRNTTNETLKNYFTEFGTVTRVLILREPLTQQSRGFGFVTFAAPSSVLRALAVPTHILDGKNVTLNHAYPLTTTWKTKKLFVGGVSQETSLEDLRSYFLQFGEVKEAILLMDHKTNRHRGFGFITFENTDIVDKICDVRFHTIKDRRVECKKAQRDPKGAGDYLTAVVNGVRTSHLLAFGDGDGTVVPAAPAPFPLAAVPTADYSKYLGEALRYSKYENYRYSPYPLARVNVRPSNTFQGHSVPGISYGPFTLPVDVVGLQQNLDWAKIYGYK